MILCLDVGNSGVKAGLFDGEELVRVTRLGSGAGSGLHDLLADVAVNRVGMASVVPTAAEALTRALRARLGIEPFVVSHQSRLPFAMAYETPASLGADRIAAAAGAIALFSAEELLVTIDAGTAVTVEVVHQGRFLGGAIMPGADLLHQALHVHTAQLPDVQPELVGFGIARSTEGSLRLGVTAALLGGVRLLLDRIRTETGRSGCVIACGGWADQLAHHLPEIDHVEPHLVLKGVKSLIATRSD